MSCPIGVTQVLGEPHGKDDPRARLEWIARAGYGARGIVYVMVGWLALAAAWDTGRAEDTKGALRSLLDEPFGQVMLRIIALGLAARGFPANLNSEQPS